jgi:hypothetical protein
MSDSGLERLKKMISDHQDEQYSFSRMEMNMSEPDRVKFIHGRYTMHESKRATESWEAHSTMGHMSQKQLEDAFENGLHVGSYLTRADADRAYCLLEDVFHVPRPSSGCRLNQSPPRDLQRTSVRHATQTSSSARQTTLGGDNLVAIATDQKTGAVFHAPARRKTAEAIEEVRCGSSPH